MLVSDIKTSTGICLGEAQWHVRALHPWQTRITVTGSARHSHRFSQTEQTDSYILLLPLTTAITRIVLHTYIRPCLPTRATGCQAFWAYSRNSGHGIFRLESPASTAWLWHHPVTSLCDTTLWHHYVASLGGITLSHHPVTSLCAGRGLTLWHHSVHPVTSLCDITSLYFIAVFFFMCHFTSICFMLV